LGAIESRPRAVALSATAPRFRGLAHDGAVTTIPHFREFDVFCPFTSPLPKRYDFTPFDETSCVEGFPLPE
jgi:hypothetical protein